MSDDRRRSVALAAAAAIGVAMVVFLTSPSRSRSARVSLPFDRPFPVQELARAADAHVLAPGIARAAGAHLAVPSGRQTAEGQRATPGYWQRTLALAAAAAIGVAAVVLITSSRSRSAQVSFPPPPRPGLAVPPPEALASVRGASRWAAVRYATVALAAPTRGARSVARVSARTPEGTTDILQLLGGVRRGPGGLWQRVRLAVLRNGTTGWVPRSALSGPVELDTRLIIDRVRFRATLVRDGTPVFTAPIGVGRQSSPTPGGDFYIRDVVTRYRSRTYGPIAFGTSARSATLTDWPAGGFVGIHGTDQPRLIPGAISHGCIRMRNADILRLAKLMPVGTPVTVK